MSKIIYLDQNKWIDLARANYDKPGGEEFKEILRILSDKVDKEEIILPMSIVHFIETARSVNIERRERLASFMVSLSKGYGILPFNAIRETEVQQAVVKKLGLDANLNIKDLVIGKGIDFALGGEYKIEGIPDNLKKEVLSKINQEEVITSLLVNSIKNETSLEIQKEDEEVLSELEDMRKKQQEELTKEMRLRVAIADMSRNLNPIVVGYLHKLGLDVKKFVEQFNSPDDWKSFFLDIPTMDIWINLHVLRDNDINRKIHRNDTNDIAFLSIAVPYCDIVVCEKYWAHMLNNSKLAEKYGCIVITSLNELKDKL